MRSQRTITLCCSSGNLSLTLIHSLMLSALPVVDGAAVYEVGPILWLRFVFEGASIYLICAEIVCKFFAYLNTQHLRNSWFIHLLSSSLIFRYFSMASSRLASFRWP